MKKFILPLLLLLAWNSLDAYAGNPNSTLDMLVADLASGDDGSRQVHARQMLPRYGAEAARKMLPLLDDPRAAVYSTATRVLEDIVNDKAFRETGDQGDEIAKAVFNLVTPTASERQKQIGLRLLPYVIKEEHSLVHVAALLKEDALREFARASLQNMGTRNALEVLCIALQGSDEAFKIDLLRAIAAYDPGKELPGLLPLLEDTSPAVAAAALRALSRTGDPALLAHARRICAASGPDNAFDAWDGWIRLTDAMAARGGNWEAAMQSYREILQSSPHTLIQSGAITGMGRYGDDTCIPVIIAALGGENGPSLEPAALEAFRSLNGRDVRRALAAAYSNCSTTMQAGMLAFLGDTAAPEYMPLLAEQARHPDGVIRIMARAALRRSGTSEAATVFQTILEETPQHYTESQTERSAALDSLSDIALRMQQAGDTNGAGRAWLAVYNHAEKEERRKTALDGIRANPVPEAFDVVLELLVSGDIESLPVDVMIGISQNVIAAGRVEDGRKLMDGIMPKLTSTDAVRLAVSAMGPKGPNPDFARLIGALNRWYFAGPFPWSPGSAFTGRFIGEPDIALDAVYPVDGGELKWQARDSQDVAGLFDLFSIFSKMENAVGFAYAVIETAEGGPAQIRLGSDDGARVWVNGNVVLEQDVDRGYAVDQDVKDITLNAGKNKILVQITQRAGGWAFGLRITHPDGTPFKYQIVP